MEEKKEERENILEIECPYCSEENRIKPSKEIKCKKCDKTLQGFKYKSIILSGFTTLIIGSGMGITADAYLNINRASVKTEYKMMKTCINYHGNYKSVRDNCACAVESMLGVIDAQKARLYSDSWLRDILNKKYKDCRD